MKRDIVWTTRFKKDYKLAIKRHMNIDLLDDIIRILSRGEKLPEKNKDHELTGDWTGHRECHIQRGCGILFLPLFQFILQILSCFLYADTLLCA